MQRLSLDDPVWLTTLPCLVDPRPDEWLPGLLLRCDEANHWTSKTTFFYVLSQSKGTAYRCWSKGFLNPFVVWEKSLNIGYVSQLLNLSPKAIYATTYHYELARCYGLYRASSEHLGSSLTFHLCPECIKEQRSLYRFLMLPHITHCPLHQTVLQRQCCCGTPLRLFLRNIPPFTCYKCRKDWSDLPRIKMASELLNVERKMLSWYIFFLTEDTSSTFAFIKAKNDVLTTLRKAQKTLVLRGKIPVSSYIRWTPPPLGEMVAYLVGWDLSPQDFGV